MNWSCWQGNHLSMQRFIVCLIYFIILQAWHRVANDESLWRNLMTAKFGVKRQPLAVGKQSWQAEYKRLFYHSPTEHSENLTLHTDEVLHVSFSHRGDMFSTTSKDATIKVQRNYPKSCMHKSKLNVCLVNISQRYTSFIISYLITQMCKNIVWSYL